MVEAPIFNTINSIQPITALVREVMGREGGKTKVNRETPEGK